MTTFTLDTSGVVALFGRKHWTIDNGVRWSDLTPFAQGYVEAMFASSDLPLAWDEVNPRYVAERDAGFRHIAPATLSRIIGDCERYISEGRYTFFLKSDGAEFYRARQAGGMPVTFPPLRVFLNDKGQVCLGVQS